MQLDESALGCGMEMGIGPRTEPCSTLAGTIDCRRVKGMGSRGKVVGWLERKRIVTTDNSFVYLYYRHTYISLFFVGKPDN